MQTCRLDRFYIETLNTDLPITQQPDFSPYFKATTQGKPDMHFVIVTLAQARAHAMSVMMARMQDCSTVHSGDVEIFSAAFFGKIYNAMLPGSRQQVGQVTAHMLFNKAQAFISHARHLLEDCNYIKGAA